MLHGILFFWLLSGAVPRMPLVWQFWLAIVLEAGWEVFENTELVIQRYRTATLSLGYEGDAVANSLGDILSCMIGFVLARKLGARYAVVLLVATDVVLLLWIRDSLLLSIVMLMHPIDSIKAWQTGH